MTEWKEIGSGKMKEFICPGCGVESKIRVNTKKKTCKSCWKTYERPDDKE